MYRPFVAFWSSRAPLNPPANTTPGAMEAGDYLGFYGPGTPFDGVTLDSTMVLVKYTYYGDADASGRVDLAAKSLIDGPFVTQGAVR
ncbi:MAG: hypothetical protein ACREJC_09030, partial [Tepidisphaeraceae bacterium]